MNINVKCTKLVVITLVLLLVTCLLLFTQYDIQQMYSKDVLMMMWGNMFTPPSKTVPKVLILSQARSGSSFLGSIMSASSNASYYYEPFKNMKIGGEDFQDFYVDKEHKLAPSIVRSVLDTLFEVSGFYLQQQPDSISLATRLPVQKWCMRMKILKMHENNQEETLIVCLL